VLGRRLSNAFFPAGVTAVAWCSPLPACRPRKTSISPVFDHVQAPPSRSRPALPGHRAATSTLRRAVPAPVKPVLKPLISGPSMPPDPATPPSDHQQQGGKSCRTRRPVAPLRSHEKVTGGAVGRGRCRIRSGRHVGAERVGMCCGGSGQADRTDQDHGHDRGRDAAEYGAAEPYGEVVPCGWQFQGGGEGACRDGDRPRPPCGRRPCFMSAGSPGHEQAARGIPVSARKPGFFDSPEFTGYWGVRCCWRTGCRWWPSARPPDPASAPSASASRSRPLAAGCRPGRPSSAFH
jgi:hypothetical protein